MRSIRPEPCRVVSTVLTPFLASNAEHPLLSHRLRGWNLTGDNRHDYRSVGRGPPFSEDLRTPLSPVAATQPIPAVPIGEINRRERRTLDTRLVRNVSTASDRR